MPQSENAVPDVNRLNRRRLWPKGWPSPLLPPSAQPSSAPPTKPGGGTVFVRPKELQESQGFKVNTARLTPLTEIVIELPVEKDRG